MDNDDSPLEWVQSCINSIGYPATIDEFVAMVDHRLGGNGSPYTALNTDLFYESPPPPSERPPGDFALAPLKDGRVGDWTVPRWFCEGDIAFFYHSVRSKKRSVTIYNKLRRTLDLQDQAVFGSAEPELSRLSRDHKLAVLRVFSAHRAVRFAAQYAGTIFAVGRATGSIRNRGTDKAHHWRSPHYCPFNAVYFLRKAIPLEKFADRIQIQQHSITPLTASQYQLLSDLVLRDNSEPAYLRHAVHRDTPIQNVHSRSGWRGVVTLPSARFLFESQLREYVIDDFVSEFVGSRSAVVPEVYVARAGYDGGIVDYLLEIEQQLIPVEVKLYFRQERETLFQIARYMDATVGGQASARTRGRTTAQVCLLLDSYGIRRFALSGSLEPPVTEYGQLIPWIKVAGLDAYQIRKLVGDLP